MNKRNIFMNNNYGKGEINNNNKHIGNDNYRNKNRKRKIIWFNSPFYKLSNINIRKYFKDLINKHFKKDNPLSKIFNRNTIKISYSCMNDIYKIIYNHNMKLIERLDLRDKETQKSSCIGESKKNAQWMEIAT